MPEATNIDLTIDRDDLYRNDDPSMHVAPEIVEKLTHVLAVRTGLTSEQVAATLSQLATVTQEQIRSHPNRFFLIPGIGALIAEHVPPHEKINPFTKKVSSIAGTMRLQMKFADEMRQVSRDLAHSFGSHIDTKDE